MYVKFYLFGLLMLITAAVSAQTNSVNAFAERNIISEGTTATIVIESSLTESVTITPSLMDNPSNVMLSVTEIAISNQTPLVSFELVVQDNNDPQAGKETFTVEFDVQPAIVSLPALTFTIPPNDLTAVVPQPAKLRIATTRQTVMVDIEPPLSGNKSFTVFLTGSGIISTIDMIIFTNPPIPIDVALKEDNLLGPEELLSLTIHHIDTYQPLTAQAQIGASSSHSCAIRADNTVACWGHPGNGATTLTSSPQGVDVNTKFLAISVGRTNYTCGITADSKAVCWGNNNQQRSNPLSSPQGVDANTKFLAVSTGEFSSCGIKADSTVACWGRDGVNGNARPTSSPDVDANTRFLAISVGSSFGCGIKTDGRVACWGTNTSRQRDLSSSPDPSVNANTKFLTVSAGGRHSCGIKTDGRLACWGRNLQKESEPTRSPHGVNADTRFLAISASTTGGCTIKADGRVACWGVFTGNRDDLLQPYSSPHNVDSNTRFLAVNVGGDHSCGIKADSTVACWGDDDSNRINPASVGFQQASTRADVVHFIERSQIIPDAVKLEALLGELEVLPSQLQFNEGETMMLTLLQAIRGPSDPITVTLIVPDENKSLLSIKPEQIIVTKESTKADITITAVDNRDVADIDPITFMLTVDTGGQASITPVATIAVTIADDGDVYNLSFVQEEIMISEGQSTTVRVSIDPLPTALSTVTATLVYPEEHLDITPLTVTFTRASPQHDVTVAVADDLFPEDTTRFTVRIAPLTDIPTAVANTLSVEISADTDPSIVNVYTSSNIIPEGTMATVAINAVLRSAVELQPNTIPTPMSSATTTELSMETVSLSAGIDQASFDIIVTDNDEPQASNNSFDLILTVPSLDAITLTFTVPPNDLTASVTQVATFKVTDTTQTMTMTITPPPQDNKSFIVASTDSRLITTGIITQAEPLLNLQLSLQDNTHTGQAEQLSVTTYHIDTRAPFSTPTAQAQISAAAEHSCAIKADNTVACWGSSANNRSNPISSPQGISTTTQFIAISAGNEHSCAIKATDNTVACWGTNDDKQSNPSSNPGIDNNTKFLAISAGGAHSCGIRIDNTIACWGNGSMGQSTPTTHENINDDTQFITISAGNEHSCGITAGNTALCWGNPANDRTDPASHLDINANTIFLAISAGGAHSCGIRIDNTVACWGDDSMDQSTPTSNDNINDNTRFIAISAGNEHSCGITADNTALCWGNPANDRTDPTSSPQGVSTDTRFLAISAGGAHSCGITADSRVVCWGADGDNRTNPTDANIQQASIAADMVYLIERSEIIPSAVIFEEVIDIAVPHPQLMLERNETTTLTFTLLRMVSESTSIDIDLQLQHPNEQEVLNLDPLQLTLSNNDRHGTITMTVASNIDASTYIYPLRLMFQVLADNVRITPSIEDNTINITIANTDLHKVSLATPAITIAEASTGIITLNIEPPSTNSVTVNLINSSTDQITIDSSATFTPGSSMTTATISIIDDNDKEYEASHIIRLTAEQSDTRTHISTPELTVTIPADNDRAIIITVSPTTLELSADDNAAIHLSVPSRFAITAPITIAAISDDFIAVTPMQLMLDQTNTTATMTVALAPDTTPERETTITLTATAGPNDEPQLTADNIAVTITGLGINIKVKVYLEGALP